MEALDKLEELIGRSSRVPFFGRVLVDEDAIYDLLDSIKDGLPSELRQARGVLKERDRILEHARSEAELILNEARAQVQRLIDESSITRQARSQADELLARAREVAGEIQVRGRKYADESLELLERHLQQLLHEVEDGRRQLQAVKDKPTGSMAAETKTRTGLGQVIEGRRQGEEGSQG
ncbi:MAG TPA: ATPase [Clostridiales bacterium UBA8153]|nr:ATPase [Clostridiales bacterium UBA8153]